MKRLLLCLLLTGCAVAPQSARLYPNNDAAIPTGVLEATLTPDNKGGGKLVLTMPDGEVINGEYTVVREGVSAFGTVFGSVYSPAAQTGAFGSALSTGTTMKNANRGVATAFGSKGTRAACEFLHDSSTQHGYGACQLSTGGVYRLQY